MTEQLTKVVAIRGTQLTVAIDSGACGGCRSQSTCGTPSTRDLEISPELATRLSPGDAVLLTVPDGASLRAATLAYVLPLCGFLTGIGGGASLGRGDAVTLMAGMAGLGGGFMVARRLSRLMRKSLNPEVCTSQR